MPNPSITITYGDFTFIITPYDIEIGGSGDATFDGRFMELAVEVQKLLAEYADVDPEVDGFRIPEK